MTTQGKNSDFPDKDTLRKYLQGKLPPDEAHKIEKLILNDPFYQEALDGMESMGEQDLEQDLKDLSSQIRKKTQLPKESRSFNFYRIAAAIILLAAFSYIIIYTTSRMEEVSKNETLSQKQETIEEDQQLHDEVPEREVEALDKSVDRDDLQTRQSDSGIAAAKKDMPEQNINESASEELTETTEEIIPNERKRTDEVVPGSEFIEPEPSEPEEEAFDQVIPKKQKVEYTLPREEDSFDLKADQEQDINFEEEKAEFVIVEEENLNVQSDQVKIQKEEKGPESEKSLTESAPVSNDIIQTSGRDRKNSKLARQSESQSSDAAKTAGAPSSISETAAEEILKPVPVNGYEDYSDYIKENIIYPKRARNDGIEGMVKLGFIINKDSIPDKVRVIQSLYPDCDKEAIRLLEEGPKWIPFNPNGELNEVELEYTISFQLNE